MLFLSSSTVLRIYIANFTNPPAIKVFKDPSQLKLECQRHTTQHKQKVLVASTDKIEYKGDNFSSPNEAPSR